jgi:predicted SAM-dependent methyltransferase
MNETAKSPAGSVLQCIGPMVVGPAVGKRVEHLARPNLSTFDREYPSYSAHIRKANARLPGAEEICSPKARSRPLVFRTNMTNESGTMTSKVRVNLGCGGTPTGGWKNFDNSPSLWLARAGLGTSLLVALGAIDAHQLNYIRFAQKNSIEWADATRRIPLEGGSADVIYSSHMLEHLDRLEASRFLGEARRVLCKGGVIRVGVPNLRRFVDEYVETGDADIFIERLYLSAPKPRSAGQRLARALFGDRHHHWMYDGPSLCRLLEESGFVNAGERVAGETIIRAPGELDLYERADESVFVEAIKA